jgi:hypothetical protein
VYLNLYAVAAAAVLLLHLLWVLFIVFGILVTRQRPWLCGLHIASLVWGVTVELGPWPCPLTALEQHLQIMAGMDSYSRPFLVHYLDNLVYPEISPVVLSAAGSAVCVINLAIYVARFRHAATDGV